MLMVLRKVNQINETSSLYLRDRELIRRERRYGGRLGEMREKRED